jgi:hypothetical protein
MVFSEGDVHEIGEGVIAVFVQPLDRGEFDEAASFASSGGHRDDLDRLGDQRARDRDHGFLDELLEPAQRAERRSRVNGSDAPGMSGAPGFQKIERLRTAHFADGNAIGPQTQRRAHEIGECRRAILGAQRDEIWGGALQFARVFDQNDAIGCLGDFREQRIDERRLAGRSSSGDQNIFAGRDGGAENRCLFLADYAGGDIITKFRMF